MPLRYNLPPPMGSRKKAIIIGAGPAGLTAAYELLTRTDILPIVLEKSEYMGGIARTINYKGNRIDIGGHRFFSKSDRVMQWWLRMLPLQTVPDAAVQLRYQNRNGKISVPSQGADPEREDRVMLLRRRKSRIYFLRRFFEYPITLSKDSIFKLGLWRTLKIGFSYFKSAMMPISEERTLDHFFINRFGAELYNTFFKSYTEKVWGIECREISAEWGAQRIKGLSVRTAAAHGIRRLLRGTPKDYAQKKTETSLIEQFLYPKYGPGHMWEEVAREIRRLGGEIRTHMTVDRIGNQGHRMEWVSAVSCETGERKRFDADYFFSTAPIRELLRSFETAPPPNVLEVSDGLVYRDFITVGLLVRRLKVHDDTPQGAKLVSDNWIYIQEPDVRLGRLQIFNNWSPYMVADPSMVWLGLEYFCNESDDLWNLSDDEMIALAKKELGCIGIIDPVEVVDGTVIRMEKTYPAYFGTYGRFQEVRDYVDRFENLFLIGRNGMHRYNNQDHSMLSAMTAVDNIIGGQTDKRSLWEVNTEMEYHEDRS